MRIRKPLGAVAVVGLSLATFAVMGTAGAQTSTTSSSSSTTTTSIAEPTDQSATVSLTCDNDVTDPIAFDMNFTTTVAKQATNGSSFPVDVSGALVVDPNLFPVPIDSIDVSAFTMSVSASGGGTMTPDPLSLAPSSFTIVINPLNVPPVSGSGTIDVTDETTPILIAANAPVTFTMVVHLTGITNPVTVNATCTVGNATIAAINGEAPATTTTTAPATTTTAVAAATTTPRYTG